ncbi:MULTISPECIES: response regulator [unclassified Pseudoalteromonas]|uniref:response regulator n=1 Tax=unclassified Pseudoalteromonas TaxID=194690 RepID=UPI000CF6E63F|nr:MULTISPECIES: response regulator [unclassified Pseudoalteromonas]MBS3796426.1 response regulator [Pseudoalteromonas sp. BDTF-M6]
MRTQDKARLLVVDDEYFNFTFYTHVLGEQFELKYAKSGEQCLKEALIFRPDAIMLDVCMPGLDGFDTCRILKNTPETKDIPILMVSGLESEAAKKHAYEVGCDAFFVKPLALNELMESLQTLI